MQLVAYGAQDIYLTGNPQITFFKVVYRRHTNFSMECIRQTFNGNNDYGGDVTATISRNGDLVHKMYVEHNFVISGAASSGLVNMGLVERYGDSFIKECEIEIGGQRIDKHTAIWNRVWSDLSQFNPTGRFSARDSTALAAAGPTAVASGASSPNGNLYHLMTGNGLGLNTEQSHGLNVFGGLVTADGADYTTNGFAYVENDADGSPVSSISGRIFLPLNFWFNRNPGLSLPLIALQYHEVKVKMTFETLDNLARVYTSVGNADLSQAGVTFTATPGIGSGSATTNDTDLWCDYIYLDTDERRRFAQVSHEYLIEQLQISDNTINTQTSSIDLNFNHPVKELVWCLRNETAGSTHGRCQPLASDGSTGDPTAGPVSLDRMAGNWKLSLNGHERFRERDSQYFTKTQVWQHHTGYGGLPTQGTVTPVGAAVAGTGGTGATGTYGDQSIAVYSFALKPEEHQPSGTCNFSRIDNARLEGTGLQVGLGTSATPMANLGDGTANSVKLTIFAVNYNVLRIMSGMGGLAYSN